MSTPVNGPGDVAVGDLVEVDAPWNSRQRTGVATVVKVTATRLTARLLDGTETTKNYTRVEVSSHGFRRERHTRHNFARLDAHERWQRAAPKCDASGNVNLEPCASFGFAAIRDRPDDVIAQIRNLSAWLKDEPSKDAP